MKKVLASIFLVACLVAFAAPALAEQNELFEEHICYFKCPLCGWETSVTGRGSTYTDAIQDATRLLRPVVDDHARNNCPKLKR